jgi:ADP-heptose:LPS heptosyltransferase
MIHMSQVRQRLIKHLLTNKYESLSFWVRFGLFLVDLTGAVLFFPCRLLRRWLKQYDPRDIKKILILRMDGLGDLVISTAALREIRKGFPEAEITLAIGPWSQGIVPCIPFYDHIIVHDAFAFGVFRGECCIHPGQELAFIRRLREGRFDLGIDIRGDILSILPLFLSGIRFRFGRDRWGGGFLLTHPVSTDRSKDVHEKDKTLALLDALEIPVTDRDLELRVPETEDAFVEQFLRECQILRDGRIVTVAPAALYFWKAWPPERYAELITRLDKEIPCLVFLIGGQGDKEILDSIANQSGVRTINCSGLLNLCQTTALLRRSALFIGNDSGLSHIAAAMKTPLIQLFGPGEPEKFGYTGPGRIIIQRADCPHHPCQQRDCITPRDWCMDKITVAEVLAAARRLLGGNGTALGDN